MAQGQNTLPRQASSVRGPPGPGQTVAATVVDHKTPHRGDWSLFWDQDNWQALCAHCHSSHKQRWEKSGAVLGCDEQGIPLDASHHWRTDREGG
ncbi:MAG: HNH endonuclease signature motif containing protein [Arhodomonas sp.]|nr:HNH endonuclease signature motif containing protein [Arhodomonas sp.]